MTPKIGLQQRHTKQAKYQYLEISGGPNLFVFGSERTFIASSLLSRCSDRLDAAVRVVVVDAELFDGTARSGWYRPLASFVGGRCVTAAVPRAVPGCAVTAAAAAAARVLVLHDAGALRRSPSDVIVEMLAAFDGKRDAEVLRPDRDEALVDDGSNDRCRVVAVVAVVVAEVPGSVCDVTSLLEVASKNLDVLAVVMDVADVTCPDGA